MKEGTAGRSLKGKMLPRAKHMGLLENITAVKDRLSDWCRQRWRQYRTWSKKKINCPLDSHCTDTKMVENKDRITRSLFLQGWLTPNTITIQKQNIFLYSSGRCFDPKQLQNKKQTITHILKVCQRLL